MISVPYVRNTLIALAFVFTAVQARADDVTFTPFSLGNDGTFAQTISDDGSTVGLANQIGLATKSYWWTSSEGYTSIGDGAYNTNPVAFSSDGSILIGNYSNFGGGAYQWTAGSGFTILPLPADTVVNDITPDAETLVGWTIYLGEYKAFKWSQATGLDVLDSLPGGTFSAAIAISGDGSTIVGQSENASFEYKPVKWTQANGLELLGLLPGGTSGSAEAVSYDGSVIVGFANSTSYGREVFRWTQANGMVGLGTLGGSSATPTAVSANGNIIIGYSYDAGDVQELAFRWTQAVGMRSLESILQSAGVDLTGWNLRTALDVSADGSVIVGWGTYLGDYRGFIITDAGMLPVDEFQDTILPLTTPISQSTSQILQISSQSLSVAQNALTTYLRDFHNAAPTDFEKLSTQEIARIAPAAGNNIGGNIQHHALYVTGNWGAGQMGDWANHDVTGTSGFLFEVKKGLAIGAGVTYSKENEKTFLNGDNQAESLGAVFLGSYDFGDRWHLFGSASLSDFSIETQRHYHNGSGIEESYGATDGYGVGMAARLGYTVPARSLLLENSLEIMPYVGFDFSHTRLDAYQERGGAFPASVSAQQQNYIASQVGVQFDQKINESLSLNVRAGWGHEFSHAGSAVAHIATLSQNLPTETSDKNWVEGAVAVNYRLNDQTHLSGELSTHTGETSQPQVNALVSLVWNWN